MTEFLSAVDDGDPVGAVCDAARIVLRMYADNPEFSVQRYRLTREVPGLRTYELSVVRRYEQTLAGHLRNRFGEGGDGALRAEVIAASVVAAHNNGLRLWLRSGGEGDPEWRSTTRSPWCARSGQPVRAGGARGGHPRAAPSFPASGGGGEDEVIVMVARKGTPMWRVVQQIEAAVAEN